MIIGRNTGRNEFAGHVRTLGKFGKLRDFILVLGGDSRDLERAMHDLEQLAAGAVRQRDVAKAAVGALASDLDRTVPELARIVGQREAEANAIPELLAALTEQIDAWRRTVSIVCGQRSSRVRLGRQRPAPPWSVAGEAVVARRHNTTQRAAERKYVGTFNQLPVEL